VAQGETCPDAFYREPWGKAPHPAFRPPSPPLGERAGVRGVAPCNPRLTPARGGLKEAVGHLLAPLPGLFSASSATPVRQLTDCGFSGLGLAASPPSGGIAKGHGFIRAASPHPPHPGPLPRGEGGRRSGEGSRLGTTELVPFRSATSIEHSKFIIHQSAIINSQLTVDG
jgi:hypothetical protein